MAILDVLAITWCNLRDLAMTGCGDLDWVQALSTAFSLLRQSLNVLKITVANARTRSHTALTRGAFEPPSTIQRKSITHSQRDPLPAAHPGPWSSPPSSKHRKRRVCSGSRPIPKSGGDAHSFMTFGLCTRNEKCAPSPLTIRALPRCCLRVACGLPAGYLKVTHGSISGGKPRRGKLARHRGLPCHRLKNADPGRELVSDFPPRSYTVASLP